MATLLSLLLLSALVPWSASAVIDSTSTFQQDETRTNGGSLRGLLSSEDKKKHNEKAWTKAPHTVVGPFVGSAVTVDLEGHPQGNSNNNDEAPPQRTSRIIDGVEAAPHSFFVMILVERGNDWRWSGCGGTLVSNCQIITAAHCASNPTISMDGVFVQAQSPFSDQNSNIPYHFSRVRLVESHPNYNAATNQADIAILHMRDCLNVEEFPPALIAEDSVEYRERYISYQSPPPPIPVEVLGFGSMSDNANVPADTLRQVTLPFLSRKDCLNFYTEADILEDMVCAGYVLTGGPDACQGDSGGPLLDFRSETITDSSGTPIGVREVPRLVGIVSWGVGCGRKDFPGVYIYVPYYRSWIWERICPLTTLTFPRPWCNDETAFVRSELDSTIASGTIPQRQSPTSSSLNSNANNLCRSEGQICLDDSDCCSSYCRGGSYKRCSGERPTTGRQDQDVGLYDSPVKRGGAAGANRRQGLPP